MKTTFISTNSISTATRQALAKVQQQLADGEKEMTTGRFADVGRSLGFRTGQSISLRQEYSRLTTIVETNSTVSTRLKTTQTTLQSLSDSAAAFAKQLLSARGGGGGAAIAQAEAKSRLEGFIDSASASFAGGYLFSGVNTDVKPLPDYYGTPTSSSRQAVASAFQAQFGMTQSDPNAQIITAADMQMFLDTTFADLFKDPAWSTSWSSASPQNVRSRISTTETIDTSTNANETAFRKLAMAYTMVADLGVENLNQQAYETVVDQATKIVNEAIQSVGDLQSRLGVTEQRVKDASERMSLQRDILTSQVKSLEGVDPNEAATRVNELTTQLDTSYALTSRIMGLSILKYL